MRRDIALGSFVTVDPSFIRCCVRMMERLPICYSVVNEKFRPLPDRLFPCLDITIYINRNMLHFILNLNRSRSRARSNNIIIMSCTHNMNMEKWSINIIHIHISSLHSSSILCINTNSSSSSICHSPLHLLTPRCNPPEHPLTQLIPQLILPCPHLSSSNRISNLCSHHHTNSSINKPCHPTWCLPGLVRLAQPHQ